MLTIVFVINGEEIKTTFYLEREYKMTKKFTEEQYQKIVETVNKYPDFGGVYYVENGWVESKPTNTFNQLIEALSYTVSGESEVNRMLALANPLTRDLVKKDLVEREYKFLFTKIKEVEGAILSLNQVPDVSRIFLDYDDPTPLTIKQVEEYGYNLDAFTKTPYEHSTLEEEDDLPF